MCNVYLALEKYSSSSTYNVTMIIEKLSLTNLAATDAVLIVVNEDSRSNVVALRCSSIDDINAYQLIGRATISQNSKMYVVRRFVCELIIFYIITFII